MKHTLYIPVMNSNINVENREYYLNSLHKMNADKIFIAVDRASFFMEDRTDYLKSLNENLKYFKENGFETGIWMQAFGFGDPLSKSSYKKSSHYTKLKSVTGVEATGDAFCPENEQYMKDYCSWIYDAATLNPDLIMLDDDLCLSVRPGIGCFCDKHLKLIENELGRKIDDKQLCNLIFTGCGNIYRDAWLNVMGNTLRQFCRKIRDTVDKVNKNIRLGFASEYTSCEIYGAKGTLIKDKVKISTTIPPYGVIAVLLS